MFEYVYNRSLCNLLPKMLLTVTTVLLLKSLLIIRITCLVFTLFIFTTLHFLTSLLIIRITCLPCLLSQPFIHWIHNLTGLPVYPVYHFYTVIFIDIIKLSGSMLLITCLPCLLSLVISCHSWSWLPVYPVYPVYPSLGRPTTQIIDHLHLSNLFTLFTKNNKKKQSIKIIVDWNSVWNLWGNTMEYWESSRGRSYFSMEFVRKHKWILRMKQG